MMSRPPSCNLSRSECRQKRSHARSVSLAYVKGLQDPHPGYACDLEALRLQVGTFELVELVDVRGGHAYSARPEVTQSGGHGARCGHRRHPARRFHAPPQGGFSLLTLDEAARGSADIAQNILSVAEVAKGTAEGAQELAGSSMELSSVSNALQQIVRQFRI